MDRELVWRLRVIVLLVLCCSTVTAANAQSVRSKEYWKKIAENRYAVPEGEKAFALAKELSANLKLSDPELRDDLAYSILAEWILHQSVLNGDELLALEAE